MTETCGTCKFGELVHVPRRNRPDRQRVICFGLPPQVVADPNGGVTTTEERRPWTEPDDRACSLWKPGERATDDRQAGGPQDVEQT